MCFRDRYSFVYSIDKIWTYFKFKDVKATVKASFKYLLFNHHERMFKIKNSFESRLFKPIDLANLDSV